MMRTALFKSLLSCFLLLFVSRAAAQINESDTVRFQLRSALTGNYQQGNVELLNIRGRLEFSWAPGRVLTFKSQNSSLYQAFYNKKADNDVFSRNYLYINAHKRVYPFAIAYLSANFRRKIDLRYFAGAGATWQAINQKYHVLKFSASVVYEQSRFSATSYNDAFYDGSNRISLWRGTLWMGGWHYLGAKRLRLYYDAFWQPAFDRPKNYRWQTDVGFDVPMWKGLALNALYTVTHENTVIRNVKPEDRLLTFGLSWRITKR